MNPALLNYYQQTQMNQGAANAAPMPAPEQQTGYNPFDAGISKAIESARESMGMTQKQQDRAMRNSLLSFAQNMSQQPKEKGFFANFGAAGRALAPALNAYDQEEDAAFAGNNALANQILQHRAQEQNRLAADDDRMWKRQMAEKEFGENIRQHNLLDNFRNRSLDIQEQKREGGNNAKNTKLYQMLERAEQAIKTYGGKSRRGRLETLADKMLPGGYPANEGQTVIDTIGNELRGELNKAWGYTNKEEFLHIPTISSNNTPENNLAIIRQLKQGIGGYNNTDAEDIMIDDGEQIQDARTSDTVIMQDQRGDIYKIPIEEVPDAEQEGLTIIR